MLTKTKVQTNKTNQSLPIPIKAQKEIKEKGFFLYNWIGSNDVKLSIERDFLRIIKNYGTFFSLILILPCIVLILLELFSLFYIYFISTLGVIIAFLFIYLIILAIKRSNILRKNSHILITDSSILINGRISKLKGFIYDYDLIEIGDLFEEKLFYKSRIHKTKRGFINQVFDQIFDGYGTIFKLSDGKKGSIQLMLILTVLYSIYSLSLWIIYIFGIFFIWIFGIILSIINKLILLKTGHEITIINDNFENIDFDSKELIIEKNNLSKLLTDAMNNDWKSSLLTKIKTGIEDINVYASRAIDTSIILKKQIESSKYKEMFNFSIYNSWIKKQIYTPLKQILDLLDKNLKILEKNKTQIEKQILKTSDSSLQGSLTISKTRTQMRIEEIQKHINKISIYINKLK